MNFYRHSVEYYSLGANQWKVVSGWMVAKWSINQSINNCRIWWLHNSTFVVHTTVVAGSVCVSRTFCSTEIFAENILKLIFFNVDNWIFIWFKYHLKLLLDEQWTNSWKWIFVFCFEFVPVDPMDKNSVGFGNYLAPNRRQAIIWNSYDPVHWHIYASTADVLAQNSITLCHVTIVSYLKRISPVPGLQVVSDFCYEELNS